MGTEHFQSQLQSTELRLAILSKWDIPKGSRILELGFGQGDCTAVLAELVGPNGHVTAVDPGSLDYGSPYTLGQAQDNLSSSVLGPRITWKHADPVEFLKNHDGQYDIAVLVLCTWYFASPKVLSDMLSMLAKSNVGKVCIAEWSLSSNQAQSHILAALAQAALQYHNLSSSANIRTLFSPAVLEASATVAGLKLERSSTLIPADNVLDGLWEVQIVLGDGFMKDLDSFVKDDRQRSLIMSMRDAVRASYEQAGGKKQVRSMDVWYATFLKA
ncbi:S-adenosyl-L-methionine-dependent methyltransferase [Desarmillaria tabescens]|uniref:S-adenosyl-L-methionine-dependent methyltransferase n=1 Tax=Armillaria tabescens TaxID=1929756 RepID=A0AA39MNI3_ARMTA|nr:S-adenosyl-L-methionine-dependent methyltransferase [Desarmillaria tabescens]KAK0440463.1 S-adenosyl-L-methionine-dependent methyltransferase [Desarmillaria tabescens]